MAYNSILEEKNQGWNIYKNNIKFGYMWDT